MGWSPRRSRPDATSWHAGDLRVATGLLLVTMLWFQPAAATGQFSPQQAVAISGDSFAAKGADATALEQEGASSEVRYVADWIARSGDNQAMPYIIIDKVDARVYVFDAIGRLGGTAAALLGMERGDGSAAGLGTRALAAISPDHRTTPAGRFVASLGRDLKGQDILWVDYETSLALHRVVKGTASERRAQRLQSPAADDNRISYGCINVPVAFFEGIVSPAFTRSSGVVYILPETSPAKDMFERGGGDIAPSVP